jgi:hypothetical protein
MKINIHVRSWILILEFKLVEVGSGANKLKTTCFSKVNNQELK